VNGGRSEKRKYSNLELPIDEGLKLGWLHLHFLQCTSIAMLCFCFKLFIRPASPRGGSAPGSASTREALTEKKNFIKVIFLNILKIDFKKKKIINKFFNNKISFKIFYEIF
jgi:hypothetical protein